MTRRRSSPARSARPGGSTRLGYAAVSTTNPLQWTFQPTVALAAVTHTLTADVENAASGSQGAMSLGFTVVERPLTLDVIDDLGALQDNVPGFANGTGGVDITDDTTLALNGSTGTASNLGEQVKVLDNGVALGSATVSGTRRSYAEGDLTRVGGTIQPAQPHLVVIDLGATSGTVRLALVDVLTGNVSAFTNSHCWTHLAQLPIDTHLSRTGPISG